MLYSGQYFAWQHPRRLHVPTVKFCWATSFDTPVPPEGLLLSYRPCHCHGCRVLCRARSYSGFIPLSKVHLTITSRRLYHGVLLYYSLILNSFDTISILQSVASYDVKTERWIEKKTVENFTSYYTIPYVVPHSDCVHTVIRICVSLRTGKNRKSSFCTLLVLYYLFPLLSKLKDVFIICFFLWCVYVRIIPKQK